MERNVVREIDRSDASLTLGVEAGWLLAIRAITARSEKGATDLAVLLQVGCALGF